MPLLYNSLLARIYKWHLTGSEGADKMSQNEAFHQGSHCLLAKNALGGAQWLSGRVLNLRVMGSWFEPHWRHCVVS